MSTYACAVDSYEQSKLDAKTVTTSTSVRTCTVCKGTGTQKDNECDVCSGEGTVEYTETRKTIRGQAGDPNHLRVQVDCLKEINRIRGHHQHDKQTVNVFAKAEQVIVGVDLSGAREDDMLDALDVFDRLTQTIPGESMGELDGPTNDSPGEFSEGRSSADSEGLSDLDSEEW
jgi:RecJ-like exonuclease